MSNRAQFDGSKRKTREREADERAQVREARTAIATFQEELAAIEALAPHIENQAHFDEILAAITDEAVRSEARKLLEPLCWWNQRQIVLADEATLQRELHGAPEKQTTRILES